MAMVLHTWRDMCPGHKWGHLWDVLHGRGHGTSAKTVLAHSKTLRVRSCEYNNNYCIASVFSPLKTCVTSECSSLMSFYWKKYRTIKYDNA